MTAKAGVGRILSVGCGDGSVEIGVAKELLTRDVTNFEFICADLSPILLDRLRESVEKEGLSEYFTPQQIDLNLLQVEGEFDVIMANHSLHHIEALEDLFEFCRDRLRDGGIFATCDMIGRNGHMRWPEAAILVKALWPTLEPKQQYHYQLARHSSEFQDHDCSTEGFEGIRAQDILPLLLDKFRPYKFFATGGFVDMLVDRGYGPGYDVGSAKDVSLVRFLCDMNEVLLDAGVLKPTWMMAYFTKDDRGERFYRDRRAIRSIRNRDGNPSWTRFYDFEA